MGQYIFDGVNWELQLGERVTNDAAGVVFVMLKVLTLDQFWDRVGTALLQEFLQHLPSRVFNSLIESQNRHSLLQGVHSREILVRLINGSLVGEWQAVWAWRCVVPRTRRAVARATGCGRGL